jgi:hypothetical protein
MHREEDPTMTSQPSGSTPTREVQRASAQFKQALAMLYGRYALLNAEVDLWPDQCQGLLLAVRAVQPAARALRGWALPPELVVIVPTRLDQIERVLVDEAVLRVVAVKAVCRSARVADLRLRLVAQQHLDDLLECGQAVLDDLWLWSVMQQEGAEQQRSRGVPHLWMVEAEPPHTEQDRTEEE